MVENPNTTQGIVRIKNNETVVIPNYEHCFCNALLNFSGTLKYERAKQSHDANIQISTALKKLRESPRRYDDIKKLHPDLYENILIKSEHPELPFALEYPFDELEKIESEIHIIGLSPNNDSHVYSNLSMKITN